MKNDVLMLDQMIDACVARSLELKGYKIVRVADLDMARAEDDEILKKAVELDIPLVTLDEHFGDWAVLPLQKHAGVIRLKCNPATSPNIERLLLSFLSEHKRKSFRNMLVIVTSSKIRWIKTGDA